jgi:hypothetical protein
LTQDGLAEVFFLFLFALQLKESILNCTMVFDCRADSFCEDDLKLQSSDKSIGISRAISRVCPQEADHTTPLSQALWHLPKGFFIARKVARLWKLFSARLANVSFMQHFVDKSRAER